MRNKIALMVIAAVALGGCAALRPRASTPDEFAVARSAPLIVPPDFSLTPPAAGTVTNTPQDAQQQAIEALFGGPAPRPQSESSLLDAAGRQGAALGARSVAGDPNTNVIDFGATTQAILAAPDMNSEVASAQVP